MRLLFRFLLIVLLASFRKKNLQIPAETKLSFIALPSDCVVLYMANDRYLSFLDLGRVDLMLRAGLYRKTVNGVWRPHVITTHIHYKRAIRLFSRFTLRTKVIGTDRIYFLIEQVFEQNDLPVATAISKCIFKGKGGIVSTAMIFKVLRRNLHNNEYNEKYQMVDEMDLLLRNIS